MPDVALFYCLLVNDFLVDGVDFSSERCVHWSTAVWASNYLTISGNQLLFACRSELAELMSTCTQWPRFWFVINYVRMQPPFDRSCTRQRLLLDIFYLWKVLHGQPINKFSAWGLDHVLFIMGLMISLLWVSVLVTTTPPCWWLHSNQFQD
jgi:hypothetical protein